MGKFNFLEEDKKVLRERLARYIAAVPKMKDELSELRKAVKDKMLPSSNKAESEPGADAVNDPKDRISAGDRPVPSGHHPDRRQQQQEGVRQQEVQDLQVRERAV